jgi:hypothetical protein
MMRKICHIVISLALLLSTIGVSITRHYCEGKLVSVSLENTHKSCCGEKCKSCHSDSFLVKVTDNFTVSQSNCGPNLFRFCHTLEFLPLQISFISPVLTNRILYFPQSPPLIIHSEAFFQVFRC